MGWAAGQTRNRADFLKFSQFSNEPFSKTSEPFSMIFGAKWSWNFQLLGFQVFSRIRGHRLPVFLQKRAHQRQKVIHLRGSLLICWKSTKNGLYMIISSEIKNSSTRVKVCQFSLESRLALAFSTQPLYVRSRLHQKNEPNFVSEPGLGSPPAVF